MADLVRSLTRLFRWGSPDPSPEVAYAPDTAVAQRFWSALETDPLAAPPQDGEALRHTLLPRVKQFIHQERSQIEAAHRHGAGGLEVVALHADLVDAVISQLFRLAEELLLRDVRDHTEGCAIVALLMRQTL